MLAAQLTQLTRHRFCENEPILRFLSGFQQTCSLSSRQTKQQAQATSGTEPLNQSLYFLKLPPQGGKRKFHL